MSSSRYVSKAAKTLLKNTIQSSNIQNRQKEEDWMWKMHEKEKSKKRKYMNEADFKDDDEYHSRSSSNADKKYWLKKLDDEEKKIPERWGHDGYKELYPEEFDSSDSKDDLNYHRKKYLKKNSKPKTKKYKKKK